jgi:thiol-disulfide isomerase/thioredoxin
MAPELRGIVGWINTEPFTLRSLRGKVVLIDFWTYTCVNCIRTFPFLKEWHERYADYGLVIVGVHSPEFEFEKIRENVEAAVAQYDLRWRIVQDNAFFTWHAFSNYAWPSKYLIDKDGGIRYIHVGEGAYADTEEKIRELLAEIGAPVYQIPIGTTLRPDRDPKATTRGESGQTRELYAGYIYQTETHYVGNTEYYSTPKNSPTLYQDPGEHRNNLLYLQGLWTNGSESLTHARVTEALEDYIGIKFFGTTVNVVLNYTGNAPFRVVVTLAGNPIPKESSGADVQYDDDGTSFFLVNEPRMYRVVELPQYGGDELRLASDSDQFSVFAFTFGSYVEGP